MPFLSYETLFQNLPVKETYREYDFGVLAPLFPYPEIPIEQHLLQVIAEERDVYLQRLRERLSITLIQECMKAAMEAEYFEESDDGLVIRNFEALVHNLEQDPEHAAEHVQEFVFKQVVPSPHAEQNMWRLKDEMSSMWLSGKFLYTEIPPETEGEFTFEDGTVITVDDLNQDRERMYNEYIGAVNIYIAANPNATEDEINTAIGIKQLYVEHEDLYGIYFRLREYIESKLTVGSPTVVEKSFTTPPSQQVIVQEPDPEELEEILFRKKDEILFRKKDEHAFREASLIDNQHRASSLKKLGITAPPPEGYFDLDMLQDENLQQGEE